MMDWIESLTTVQTVLFAFGGIGSLLFLIQVLAMMFGIGDSDTDADVDADADVEADADGAHADSDVDFKVISIQGTVAFFMMMGWVGLALNRSSGFGIPVSIGVGAGVGFATNLFVAKVFQSFKKLQSSGTMNLKNAIGEQGAVYLTIQADEPGKIQVAVQEHLKVFEAVSEDGTQIPTDTRVEVVDVVKGNTMVVKRI